MNAVARFLRFCYDFVIGDDWTVAAGVVLALALTGLLASAHVVAWWLPPIAVAALLALSLLRATRHR